MPLLFASPKVENVNYVEGAEPVYTALVAQALSDNFVSTSCMPGRCQYFATFRTLLFHLAPSRCLWMPIKGFRSTSHCEVWEHLGEHEDGIECSK